MSKSSSAVNFCIENDVSIAFLTETWFFNDFNYQTALFKDIGQYDAYNRPRITNTIGGGVCIFLKDNLKGVQQKKKDVYII